jgi:hypothetical protein
LGRVTANSKIKLTPFTTGEITYLKEYAQVMSPVAIALDMLQGEEQAYLGCLLPTLALTIMQLESTGAGPLVYCAPLVNALLAGIKKRFNHLLDDLECQLAAAFHPRFRLYWLTKHDPSRVSAVKEAMESQVEACMKEENEIAAADSSSSDSSTENGQANDDWYDSFSQPSTERASSRNCIKTNAAKLVSTWLEGRPKKKDLSDSAFMNEKVLIKLFIKYNTAVPSSAAVERVFSMGKDILRAKRASLSDETFEMLMFMRGNKHHWKNITP